MNLWDCDGVILDANRVVCFAVWFCFEGGEKKRRGGGGEEEEVRAG